MRSLIYYIAVSADGFIADPSGDTSAFPQDLATLRALFAEYPETCPSHVRAHFGIDGPSRRFDAVIMGMRTHQPALDAGLTSAYPHLDQYVVTHRRDLPEDPAVTIVHDDPVGLVTALKQQPGRDIWLCGGADLAAQLVAEIDEIHLKVNPILLGSGISLLRGALPHDLEFVSSRELPGGVLLNTYHC